MSGEETEETVSVTLPGDLVEWVDDRTGEDADREAAIRDLMVAVRRVSEDGQSVTADSLDPEEVDRRLESQRQEYTELVEDVRERVIQVKREADAKARADHAHPEIESSFDDLEGRIAEVEGRVDDVRESVAELSDDLDSGFDNYEDVLTHLADTTEEIEDRLDVLARAVVETRESLHEVAAGEAAREGTDRLKLAASREGIAKADCEECDATVRIGLLTRPECPHCATTFSDVEAASGFFGSNRLLTGTPPAIGGEVGTPDDELVEMVEGAVADDGGSEP